MVALSFTTILIQVQAAYQGNARDLLPILIAALLAMAGMARSLGTQPELARRSGKCPPFLRITVKGGHFLFCDVAAAAKSGYWCMVLEHAGGQSARVELRGA
jgi:hypothetical protein